MKKLIISLTLSLVAGTAFAQTTFEEVSQQPLRACGLYYPYQSDKVVAVLPLSNYKPFYISHYGRHGSRYLVEDQDYLVPLKAFQDAEDKGKLTDAGRDVLRRLEAAWADAKGRTGELTEIGARQHHDIATRMYKAWPEVFAGKPRLTATSTVRMRCAMSMAAFCDGLKEQNPRLEIPLRAAQRYMSYMANTTPAAGHFNRWDGPAARRTQSFDSAMTRPDRLMSVMFNDPDYVAGAFDARAVMSKLFLIAIDLPNTACGVTLDDIFTPEERFDLWRAMNYRYYNHMSNPASANGVVLDNARPLLANILESAREMIASKGNGADLRFGHDSCIVPLLGLIKADGCYGSTDDPYKLHEVYADFKISPMAANLQFIFFRDRKGDVIVKAMLNERDIRLPIQSDVYPFYHWKDVDDYFSSILAAPAAK